MRKVFVTVLAMMLVLSVVFIPRAVSAVEVPILMYHSVDDTGGMYTVTEEKLENDIIALKEAGYTTVSFDDLIAYAHQGAELPEKPVVITFDDGYENNCSILLPMAERLDFKFEVFTVAGFIQIGPSAMVWEQVKAVNDSPNGNIGCHTYNMHGYVDNREGVIRKEGEDFRTWEHIFRNDLSIAKTLFKDNTGAVPRTFAYPYGNFTAEADRVLREEGYLVTVTTEPGINMIEKGDIESLYMMMRISMDGQAYSAVEMIEACRGINYSAKIANARDRVWSEVNVSRRDAIKALYTKMFADEPYDFNCILGYRDLKHEPEDTKILFAQCVANNIISGFPDWTMRPSSYITRGEFAIMLARRTGYDGREASYRFTDSSAWNDWALSWCYEKGYMIGYGEAFGVNDFLTKEQIDLVCSRAGL